MSREAVSMTVSGIFRNLQTYEVNHTATSLTIVHNTGILTTIRPHRQRYSHIDNYMAVFFYIKKCNAGRRFVSLFFVFFQSFQCLQLAAASAVGGLRLGCRKHKHVCKNSRRWIEALSAGSRPTALDRGPQHWIEVRTKKNKVSQMKVQVMTIKTHTKSSKSELS